MLRPPLATLVSVLSAVPCTTPLAIKIDIIATLATLPSVPPSPTS